MARILIADDRELVRAAMRGMLRQADHDWEVCGEASDGAEAINKTVELAPDLVILDVAMPGLDGISTARRIRAQMPNVPILIYTFLNFPHLEIAARQAGAQGVIQKGDWRALVAEMRRVLGATNTAGASSGRAEDGAAALLNLASAKDGAGALQSKKPREKAAEGIEGEDLPPTGGDAADR